MYAVELVGGPMDGHTIAVPGIQPSPVLCFPVLDMSVKEMWSEAETPGAMVRTSEVEYQRTDRFNRNGAIIYRYKQLP
jgi:hypothetical protein